MKEYNIPHDKVMHTWYMPHDLCDDLIDYYESSPHKNRGQIGGGIDEKAKKSTDVSLSFSSPLFTDYVEELQKGIDTYQDKYPVLQLESRYDNLNEATEIILERGDKFHVYRGLRHQMFAMEDTDMFEFSTQHFDSDSHRIIKGD